MSPLSPILKKLIGKRKNKNKIVFLEIGDNGDKLFRKPSESPYLQAFYVSPLLSPNPFRGQIRGQRGQMGNPSKILGKPVNTGFLALFLLIPQGTDENSGDTFQSFPFVPVVPVSPKSWKRTIRKYSKQSDNKNVRVCSLFSLTGMCTCATIASEVKL